MQKQKLLEEMSIKNKGTKAHCLLVKRGHLEKLRVLAKMNNVENNSKKKKKKRKMTSERKEKLNKKRKHQRD